MSSTTGVGGTHAVQSITQNILSRFDTDGDSRLSSAEFQTFLQNLLSALSSSQLNAGGGSALQPASAASKAHYDFRGFDASRAQSAAGSLKYDAYNVLQRFDPRDPTAMPRAFQELSQVHPGQYELDPQDNLMLTGTADGYIGARPNDRQSDWTNRNQPWNWSWMAYNSAHPGPNGEGL